MTRPGYQMISHRALGHLLHRDCEFRIGSNSAADSLLKDCPGASAVPQKADHTIEAYERQRWPLG